MEKTENMNIGLDYETQGENLEISTNNVIAMCYNIAEKTIGFELISLPFDEIGDKLNELIEKATNGEFTTNKGNGLTTPLALSKSNRPNLTVD